MEALPELAVLELPSDQRDATRVEAVASALSSSSVLELPFLRSLDAEELKTACKTQLRIDRLRPGEAICLQGEEADAAYVVLQGTISCHIRKDLQQMEPALAYAKLVSEFTEALEAKAAAAERHSERLDRRGSLDPSAAPAGAPSSSVISAALGPSASAPTPPAMPPAALVQQRRGSGPTGPPSPSFRRRYMMVPSAEGELGHDSSSSSGLSLKRLSSSFVRRGVGTTALSGGSWRKVSGSMLTGGQLTAALRTKLANALGASVAVLGVGDTFGESCLLPHGQTRRAASAVCNTPCALLVIPRAALSSDGAAEREKQLLEFLRSVPALIGCNNATLAQLLRTSKRRKFSLGEKLTAEQSKGSVLLLITEGEAMLSMGTGTHMPPSARAHPTSAAINRAAVHAAAAASAASPAYPDNGGDLGAALGALVEASNATRLSEAEGGAHTPRQIQLRAIGAGQLVPCSPSPSSGGLADGVVFPLAACVASAHCEVMQLDSRFLSVLLAKQDANGRGLDTLHTALANEAMRMAELRHEQSRRWKDELTSPRFRQAHPPPPPNAPPPPARPDTSQVTMAHHPKGLGPIEGVGLPPPPPPEPLHRKPPPDPIVSALSKYHDPENPTGRVAFSANLSARPSAHDEQQDHGGEAGGSDGGVARVAMAPAASQPAVNASRPGSARPGSARPNVSRPGSARPGSAARTRGARPSVEAIGTADAAAAAASGASSRRPSRPPFAAARQGGNSPRPGRGVGSRPASARAWMAAQKEAGGANDDGGIAMAAPAPLVRAAEPRHEAFTAGRGQSPALSPTQQQPPAATAVVAALASADASSELAFTLTPRQLRPQSAAAADGRSRVIDRQNAFLEQLSTLHRYPGGVVSRGLRGGLSGSRGGGTPSPAPPAAAAAPREGAASGSGALAARQRPQTAEARLRRGSPQIAVTISSGEDKESANIDPSPVAALAEDAPQVPAATASAAVPAAAVPAAAVPAAAVSSPRAPTRPSRPSSARSAGSSSWVPRREEWRHIARLAAARGVQPPAPPPHDGGDSGSMGEGAREEFAVRPPAAERTPLAVSLLNDDAFVGKVLAKRSQQQQQQALFGAHADFDGSHFMKPYVQIGVRAPWFSNAVLGSFLAEEQHQMAMLAPRAGLAPNHSAANTARRSASVSPRRLPAGARTHREGSARETAKGRFPGRFRPPPSPPPPSPAGERSAAGFIARAMRSPKARTRQPPPQPSTQQQLQQASMGPLWTRPIAVDGPGVANALAFQQASLA